MGNSSIWTFLLAIVGAVLVIYLSYVFSKYMAKGMNKLGSAKYIDVIDRMILGQDKSLAIIQIGEKYYLISMTNSNISMMKEILPEDLMEINNLEEKISTSKSIKGFRDLLKENIYKEK